LRQKAAFLHFLHGWERARIVKKRCPCELLGFGSTVRSCSPPVRWGKHARHHSSATAPPDPQSRPTDRNRTHLADRRRITAIPRLRATASPAFIPIRPDRPDSSPLLQLILETGDPTGVMTRRR